MSKPKCSCVLCRTEISVSNIANHFQSCFRKLSIIKVKKKRTNHHLMTPEARAKATNAIAKAHQDGKYAGSRVKSVTTRTANGTLPHSAETKRKITEKALASKHQRVCKSSHTYTDKHGRTFLFDSKWEDMLANRLDSLDVEWERPKPIAYECDGKTRNYFADFYLPAFDLYLDPKNAYCEAQQKKKLDIVKTKIQLLILRTADECKTFYPK